MDVLVSFWNSDQRIIWITNPDAVLAMNAYIYVQHTLFKKLTISPSHTQA